MDARSTTADVSETQRIMQNKRGMQNAGIMQASGRPAHNNHLQADHSESLKSSHLIVCRTAAALLRSKVSGPRIEFEYQTKCRMRLADRKLT